MDGDTFVIAPVMAVTNPVANSSFGECLTNSVLTSLRYQCVESKGFFPEKTVLLFG